MSATHATQSTVPQGPVLCMAIESSMATWKLAFTVGSGQKPRIRSAPAGALLFQVCTSRRPFPIHRLSRDPQLWLGRPRGKTASGR
jgi:hypothetical protein